VRVFYFEGLFWLNYGVWFFGLDSRKKAARLGGSGENNVMFTPEMPADEVWQAYFRPIALVFE